MLTHRDIYTVTSHEQPITGVGFRGRVRKFALSIEQNLLAENSESGEEEVRFALPTNTNPQEIINYIKQFVPQASITLLAQNIPNPVLSKLKVNDESRYTL